MKLDSPLLSSTTPMITEAITPAAATTRSVSGSEILADTSM